MDYPGVMDVLDSFENGADEASSISFVIVPLCTYPVKEFTTRAQIETKIKVMRCL